MLKNGVFSECSKVAHLRIRWFYTCLQNKEKRCSRAPKARAEKIWSILREFYAKAPFTPLSFAQIAQSTQYFENAPKSLIYECERFARASRTKRNDARERRGRELRKFGAFYASFMQKCLLYHCPWQKVLKNGVFSECSKVAHLRIRWFCARLQNKEK